MSQALAALKCKIRNVRVQQHDLYYKNIFTEFANLKKKKVDNSQQMYLHIRNMI